jgi:hypothetical protein
MVSKIYAGAMSFLRNFSPTAKNPLIYKMKRLKIGLLRGGGWDSLPDEHEMDHQGEKTTSQEGLVRA